MNSQNQITKLSPRSTWRFLRLRCLRLLAILLIVLICGDGSFAYSVLTHEEIVDLLWKGDIQPLLLKRYPGLSEDQLKEAHAYAYGGAVIQDLGYYPFGSIQFSDLVHYVRSGDFVRELIAQSQDANEYAFALGALAHYASDVDGHPAVNQSVAIGYPKLRAKYGNSVRYAEGKTEHIKTEFGFDMVQVSKERISWRGRGATCGELSKEDGESARPTASDRRPPKTHPGAAHRAASSAQRWFVGPSGLPPPWFL
jgi:hypothetical protein